jgi:hypothetical protein
MMPPSSSRSAPSLAALDVSTTVRLSNPTLGRLNSDEFQSYSLKVFQSKKLWAEFQAILQEENVSNPTAVKMKLHQFIAERENELNERRDGITIGEEEDAGRAVRRVSAFDLLVKIWNPLDRSKRSADVKQRRYSSHELDMDGSDRRNGFLAKFLPSLDDSSRRNDMEDGKQWLFTTGVGTKGEDTTRKSSLFQSFQRNRDTGSTSDLTALTSSIRRESCASLASLGSLASELGEARRFEAASKRRGSNHDDLFEG